MNESTREALALLRANLNVLSRQQVKTLAGQIKSGDPDAAIRGLVNILSRLEV